MGRLSAATRLKISRALARVKGPTTGYDTGKSKGKGAAAGGKTTPKTRSKGVRNAEKAAAASERKTRDKMFDKGWSEDGKGRLRPPPGAKGTTPPKGRATPKRMTGKNAAAVKKAAAKKYVDKIATGHVKYVQDSRGPRLGDRMLGAESKKRAIQEAQDQADGFRAFVDANPDVGIALYDLHKTFEKNNRFGTGDSEPRYVLGEAIGADLPAPTTAQEWNLYLNDTDDDDAEEYSPAANKAARELGAATNKLNKAILDADRHSDDTGVDSYDFLTVFSQSLHIP